MQIQFNCQKLLFQAIQLSQTVLIQKIQYSFNVKNSSIQAFQFSLSTQLRYENSSFSSNLV